MSHDPYGTNPRRYDPDATGWSWGWIVGGLALILIVGLIVWGGSNSTNVASNANAPGSLVGTTSSAPPAPHNTASVPAPAPRSTTGSAQ